MDKSGMGRLNAKRRREEEDEGWAGFRDRGRKMLRQGSCQRLSHQGKKAPSASADGHHPRLMAPAKGKAHEKF